MHITDLEKRNWLQDKIETMKPRDYNLDRRMVILDRLIWRTEFENFLTKKWKYKKQFGLKGGETLMPGLKAMFERAADLGVESIVMGMSHRGRLNVLANVFKKPLHQIFSEFNDVMKPVEQSELYMGTGDVKYHLGFSNDWPIRDGKSINLSLLSNPSHLEAVNPLVIGLTRAKQDYSKDADRTKNLGVLIHGDGSFSGQGVVFEVLQQSAPPNYTSGGTIHIVINNQVAFTTDPRSGRSSQYCTDVAKTVDAPIFHVNGDDTEAVIHVCELAAEWHQTFHSDVVVDIISYRRNGHNETDIPSYTQPKMYQVISNHPRSLNIYHNTLLESGQISKEDIEIIHTKVKSILNNEFNNIKDHVPRRMALLSTNWTGCNSQEQISPIQNTCVKLEVLKRVGKAITTLPENFNRHSTVKGILRSMLV